LLYGCALTVVTVTGEWSETPAYSVTYYRSDFGSRLHQIIHQMTSPIGDALAGASNVQPTMMAATTAENSVHNRP
jgi:hypothetical protein